MGSKFRDAARRADLIAREIGGKITAEESAELAALTASLREAQRPFFDAMKEKFEKTAAEMFTPDELRAGLLSPCALPMTEADWSSLSRRAAERFDLSLWKKGGSCESCRRPAVFARAVDGMTWKAHRLVCVVHAGLDGTEK